jgi:hypothetical protein
MFGIRFRAEAVGAEAVYCCGSGSTKIMRLLAASAPLEQRWLIT